MFEKSLGDLVRGIRSNKKNEATYIAQCIGEIKEEIKSNDIQRKSVAVLKLVYLQMMGFDMSWAAFNVIEVMTSTKFTQKRIGYTAAAQSFTQDTEVIMLATHLIRKDMTSSNIYEAGLAIDCLSNICTADLARDLAADVVSMLNSSRPYIRKKACLVLYKIFLKFPDALRPSFARLKEKLEDPDQAVQSAAVNVICELAKKNPKNYLAVAPVLFKILTTSNNNWMLIKIIKLFGSLLPIEPRLAKKLIAPLANLINTTPAMSLLYECIQTCTAGLGEHIPTIKLCITKLRNFVEDSDQNLKYLGLVALNNIMKIHPKAVSEHRDLVLNCLDDDDISIRMRALDLLEGMVNKKNLLEIIRKLVEHIDRTENGQYKDALVEKIITICSKNSYQAISDFDWYISVLMELSRTQGTKHGNLLATQFMDVIIRVPMIRPFGVKNMVSLLRDSKLLSENPQEGGNCEVLYAAAWIVGEFSSFITDPLTVIEALLQPGLAAQPAHIQGVYIQAALKLFALVISSGAPPAPQRDLLGLEEDSTPQPTPPSSNVSAVDKDQLLQSLTLKLPLFTQSPYLEVQERACFLTELLQLYMDPQQSHSASELAREIASLFDEPLNPVGPKAQKKVKVPEGLDLDSWINEPPKPQVEIDTSADFEFLAEKEEPTWYDTKAGPEDVEKNRAAHRERQKGNAFYLQGKDDRISPDIDNIPIQTLTREQLQGSTRNTSSPFYLGATKPSKTRNVTILRDEEMPDDANSDSDTEQGGLAADIDWNEPVNELPVQKHRIVTAPVPTKEKAKKLRTKKTKQPTKNKPKPDNDLISIDDEPKPKPKTKQSAKPKAKATATAKKTKQPVKSSSQPQQQPQQQQQQAQQQAPKVNRYRPLLSDGTVTVLCEIQVNPREPNKFLAFLAIKNISNNTVTNIQVDVKGTLNVKMTKGTPSIPNWSSLAPTTADSHAILFDIQNIEQPQKISGTLSYTVNGTKASKDFQLTVPCSSFVLPDKLPAEDFYQILRNAPLTLSSCDLRANSDFQSFTSQLAFSLRAELISLDEKGAALYGKTVQGHHVAVYVKAPPTGNPYHVDLKCTSAALGTSLTSELQANLGSV